MFFFYPKKVSGTSKRLARSWGRSNSSIRNLSESLGENGLSDGMMDTTTIWL